MHTIQHCRNTDAQLLLDFKYGMEGAKPLHLTTMDNPKPQRPHKHVTFTPYVEINFFDSPDPSLKSKLYYSREEIYDIQNRFKLTIRMKQLQRIQQKQRATIGKVDPRIKKQVAQVCQLYWQQRRKQQKGGWSKKRVANLPSPAATVSKKRRRIVRWHE